MGNLEASHICGLNQSGGKRQVNASFDGFAELDLRELMEELLFTQTLMALNLNVSSLTPHKSVSFWGLTMV